MENVAYLALLIASAIFAFIALARLWTITFWPYQHEFREAAMSATTYAILKGINPFSLSAQPNYANVYGALFPIFSIPFTFTLAPENSFLATRIFSSLLLIVDAILLGWWIFRKTDIALAVPLTVLFLYQELFACSMSYPMVLGMFFLILPLAIVDVYGASAKALYLGILAGVLGFLSKQYYLISSIWIALISLFKLRLKDFIICISLLLFALWLVFFCYTKFFPALFINTVLHHVVITRWEDEVLESQLRIFCNDNWLMLYSFVAALLIILVSRWQKIQNEKISWFVDPAWIGALGGFSLFYFKMGGHSGSAPTFYMYHVFGAFLLVVWAKVIFALNKIIQDKIKENIKHINRAFFILFSSGVILVSVIYSPGWRHSIVLTPQEENDWEAVRKIVRNSRNVLNGPFVTSFLIENNLPIYDSGQSEYFPTGAAAPAALKDLSRYSGRIKKTMLRYQNKIKKDLDEAKFDTLVLSPEYPTYGSDSSLHARYELCRSFNLAMPQTSQNWRAEIYKRTGECSKL